MPYISIVIPTFNSRRFIGPCLESMLDRDYQDIEIIIVDNGSTDGTIKIIEKDYPRVILIKNKENLGACKAKNQGIEISGGKWILTLDCDIILEENFLNKLIRYAEKLNEGIGIIQPKILKNDKKTIYSCGIYLSKLMRFYDIGQGRHNNARFDKVRIIFGSCCAAALYRRRALEEAREATGYFDERFFFLAEDVDLSWRLQKMGWKAIFYPEAVCYHYGNSSFTDRHLRQYLCWRNRRLLLEKCRINKPRLVIISLFYDLPRLAVIFLTNPYFRKKIKNNLLRGLFRPANIS